VEGNVLHSLKIEDVSELNAEEKKKVSIWYRVAIIIIL